MTSPGPDRVIACPHCAAPARVATFGSISFGLHPEWSDGGTHLLKDVARCTSCRRCYVVGTAPTLDRADFWDEEGAVRVRSQWAHYAYVDAPSEADCYDALQRDDLGDAPNAELRLRSVAWHQRNQPARGNRTTGDAASLSSQSRANMERLLMLYEQQDYDTAMTRAELLRELGRFEEAAAILRPVAATGSVDAEQLLELCALGDSRVALLDLEHRRHLEEFRRRSFEANPRFCASCGAPMQIFDEWCGECKTIAT